MKNRRGNKLISVYLMFGLILLVIGFSYAFFIYNKTGLYTHTITGGKMKVIYDEVTGNNITIENAYPLTDKESETKSLEFEFTITGYNESDKNVYYAIEIDHGEDVSGKNRFLDSDMKLTLLENEEVIFENEIFSNLDNQDIYYNYFKSGTSSESPTINNYKMKIWINDYVIISDTIENDISLWDEMDYRWAESNLNYYKFTQINDGYVNNLSELGINVYTSDEFANNYANFKINVRANLKANDMGMLFYDANGGEFTPKPTSLATNKITLQKPVMEDKGFLGWSSDPDSGEVEYKSGEYYSGKSQVLYAVYSDTRNVMSDFSQIKDAGIYYSAILFIDENVNNFIDEMGSEPDYEFDLTLDEQGSVIGLIYGDALFVISEGATYLSTGYELFMGIWNGYYMLDNVDTSMVTDMTAMFASDPGWYPNGNPFEVDLSGFNTSNVESMSFMFYKKCGMKTLDLSSFDTSNVIYMDHMFNYCSGLIELDLNHFDTSNVITMEGMFGGKDPFNSSDASMLLTNIEFSDWDVSNVENMNEMFYSCYYLSKLDLGSWNASNLILLNEMFAYCRNLREINLSNFDTSNVESMAGLFKYCDSLKSIDVSNFDTSNVTDMSYMFNVCEVLANLDVRHFDTSNVTDMSYMFSQCLALEEMDLSTWDGSSVINVEYLFHWCDKLKKVDLSQFETPNLQNTEDMFSSCPLLISINIDSLITNNVTNMYGMFSDCSSLERLDLSNFNTSKVTNMRAFVGWCSSLEYLNISGFDTSKVTDNTYMFYNCKKLEILDASNSLLTLSRLFSELTNLKSINLSNAILKGDVSAMFSNKVNLISVGNGSQYSLNISGINTSQVTNMSSMFSGCSKLTTLDLSLFDTSNVTSMSNMFSGCSSLITLNLSSFDTSNVTTMNSMFLGCSSIEVLDVSNFNTSQVTNMYVMFQRCENLVTIYCDDDGWDVSKVTSSNSMFYNSTKLVGAVPYNSSKIDVKMANPDTGYFTRKSI